MKNPRVSAKKALFSGLLLPLFLAGCVSNFPAPVFGPDGQPTAVIGKDAYVVKRGDTLYSIAREHGMDPHELIALNRIENPNQISVGRVIKIKRPQEVTAPITSDVVVAKPLDGAAVIEEKSLDSSMASFKREPVAGKVPYSDQALAMAQNSPQPTAVPAAAETKSEVTAETRTAEAAPNNGELSLIWPAGGKLVGTFSEGGNKGVDIAGKSGDSVVAAGDGKVILVSNAMRGYGNLVIIKHNDTFLSAYAHNRKILVEEKQNVTKGQKIAEMGNTDAERVMLHFEVRKHGKPVDPLDFLPKRK